MGRKARVYSKVEEADELIKGLCEAQPDVLWCVRPETITVMAIENSERNEKNTTLAKIKPVKGAEKAVFQANHIPTRYIIELFWSDWHAWSMRQKQWIIFHELLHVHPDFEKSIRHDCEDFKIILDKVGVEWTKKDNLPDLLDKSTTFNLELRPSLNLNDEDDDEIKNKNSKKKNDSGDNDAAEENEVDDEENEE